MSVRPCPPSANEGSSRPSQSSIGQQHPSSCSHVATASAVAQPSSLHRGRCPVTTAAARVGLDRRGDPTAPDVTVRPASSSHHVVVTRSTNVTGGAATSAANPQIRMPTTSLTGRSSVDHVIPLSRDGEHAMHNLRCAHRWCNIIKGTALITEAF